MNVVDCPNRNCGTPIFVPVPVLYHDLERGLMIWVYDSHFSDDPTENVDPAVRGFISALGAETIAVEGFDCATWALRYLDDQETFDRIRRANPTWPDSKVYAQVFLHHYVELGGKRLNSKYSRLHENDQLRSEAVSILEDLIRWCLRVNDLFGRDPEKVMRKLSKQFVRALTTLNSPPNWKRTERLVRLSVGFNLTTLFRHVDAVIPAYSDDSKLLALMEELPPHGRTNRRSEETIKWSDLSDDLDNLRTSLQRLLTVQRVKAKSLVAVLLRALLYKNYKSKAQRAADSLHQLLAQGEILHSRLTGLAETHDT